MKKLLITILILMMTSTIANAGWMTGYVVGRSTKSCPKCEKCDKTIAYEQVVDNPLIGMEYNGCIINKAYKVDSIFVVECIKNYKRYKTRMIIDEDFMESIQ